MDSYIMRSEQQHETRRLRRRIWFTLHVAVYVVCSLGFALAPHPDLWLFALKSLLLSTIIVHFGWLYIVGLYESSMQDLNRRVYATLTELTPQPAPLLPDGRHHIVDPCYARRDFWFRWHDVG